ncbi:MAG: TIGR01777 family oxidoreductase [Planctomycetes bacterium]|nr:TIGR01777 family oxidoreductase [Planctomycetota bacterium]
MKALVTGATGFIGGELVRRLEAPRVLSRDPARARAALPGAEPFPWDAEGGPPPAEAFEGVEAVLHLAGDPVAEGRWNPEKKARIRDSRVKGTRHLVEALRALPRRPRVLVAASAVGFYGDRGDEVLAEDAAPGADFLASVCRDWEEMARGAEALGVRTVMLRIGVVLGRGGALRRMLLPFRLGLGGPLGDGRQWMPWIHVEDVVGLLLHAAREEGMRGPVNAAAPGACTNREFTRALGRVLRRPAILPAPRFGLRLAFGEFADILFASTRAVPRAALAAGYSFRHPEVEGALRASV